jgi:catechol 2,3-dioxygenase-like lactoylglutathione lyase family enzyme
MPITELNHYSIRTLDLDASEKFYTEVLGLTVGPRPSFPFPGLWLYNGDHGSYANARVHIIGVDLDDPEGLKQYMGDRDLDSLKGGTGSVDHIAFFATGIDEMLARLKKKGVTYRERTVPSLGLRQVFLEDPSQVTIELNYPAAEAPARR